MPLLCDADGVSFMSLVDVLAEIHRKFPRVSLISSAIQTYGIDVASLCDDVPLTATTKGNLD
jgi:hypothetical protein